MPGSSTADSPAPSPDVLASSSIEHIGRLADALLHQTEEGAQDRTTSGRSSDAPDSNTPRRSLDAPERSSEESASSARRGQAVVSGRIGRSETHVPLETPRAEAPGMPGSSTADSPAPSPDVLASSSIEHIGRLADALLHQTQRDAQGRVASTPTRPAGSPDGAMATATGPRQASPATGETARPLVSPLSREPGLPRLGAFGALADDRAEQLLAAEKAAAPGPPLVATGEEHIAASAPSIDPDTLATLVNDVLVEQARRHGVDLS